MPESSTAKDNTPGSGKLPDLPKTSRLFSVISLLAFFIAIIIIGANIITNPGSSAAYGTIQNQYDLSHASNIICRNWIVATSCNGTLDRGADITFRYGKIKFTSFLGNIYNEWQRLLNFILFVLVFWVFFYTVAIIYCKIFNGKLCRQVQEVKNL